MSKFEQIARVFHRKHTLEYHVCLYENGILECHICGAKLEK